MNRSMECRSRGRTDRKYVSYMGKAGEYAVASQLLIRELSVAWPAVDEGFDLQARNGCRIQVKSSHIDGQTRRGHKYYWFPLGKTKRVILKSKIERIACAKVSDCCDVVVFWGIEENRFWVVPAELCDTKTAFILGCPDTKRFFGSIQAMRDMVKLGYTHQEISDETGMQRSNVTKYINSGVMEIKRTGDSTARACENAWHYILDFGAPAAIMQEPELAIAPVPESES
jgi:hypothetical protein